MSGVASRLSVFEPQCFFQIAGIDHRTIIKQLAERMETSQSAIARLESGRAKPSARTLERLAQATNTRLHISFQPKAPQTHR